MPRYVLHPKGGYGRESERAMQGVTSKSSSFNEPEVAKLADTRDLKCRGSMLSAVFLSKACKTENTTAEHRSERFSDSFKRARLRHGLLFCLHDSSPAYRLFCPGRYGMRVRAWTRVPSCSFAIGMVQATSASPIPCIPSSAKLTSSSGTMTTYGIPGLGPA